MSAVHSDHPSDTIKMIREPLCVAQVHLGAARHGWSGGRVGDPDRCLCPHRR